MSLRKISKGFAVFLSAVFSPPLAVCYGAAAIAAHSDGEILWALLTVAVFVFPPVAYVLFLMRKRAVSGFHLAVRTERVRPLKFMVVNTSVGMALFHCLGGPPLVLDVVVSCLLALAAVFAATLYYKISAHSAAVSSLWVVLMLLYGSAAAAFAVSIPLVSWARARLGLHTLAQTFLGMALGGSVTFAALKIKGHF